MTEIQMLYGAVTLLLGVIATLLGLWWSSVKQSFADIKSTLLKINLRLDNMDKEKVDSKLHERAHDDIRDKLHKHAKLGTAGEVVT